MKKLASLFLTLFFLLAIFTFSVQARSEGITNSNLINKVDNETFKEKRASAAAEFKNKIEEARNVFKTKLASIKDARKKELAQHLQDQLDKINQQFVDHFNEVLKKLTSLLNRLEVRKDSAKALGKDVSGVELAITNARAAIATAQSAVDSESQKDYTAKFSSDSNLKSGIKTAKTQMRTDLKAVHSKLVLARSAVVSVLQALAKVNGVGQEESTRSAKFATGSAKFSTGSGRPASGSARSED